MFGNIWWVTDKVRFLVPSPCARCHLVSQEKPPEGILVKIEADRSGQQAFLHLAGIS